MSKSYIRYKIIRYFFNVNGVSRPNMIIKKDLTEEEAIKHCNDPETSSKTCTSNYRRAYTRKNGEWFDGMQSYNIKKRYKR